LTEKIIFLFKMFISLPLDTSTRGGSTNRSILDTPLLWRPRLRCEDNIKIDLTEIGREAVDQILVHLAQYGDKWRDLMTEGNLLTNRPTISFSRRTLLQRVR
jgi:hypothetical protein